MENSRTQKKSGQQNDGRRVSRVEKEIHSAVSTYIVQHLQSELPGFITVGRVIVPGDLRTAKVFVSLLQINHTAEIEQTNLQLNHLDKAIRVLQHHAKNIQTEIDRQLKMKYLPKLTFMPDESTEKILKIEKLLSTLDQKDPATNIDDFDEDTF